MTSVCPEYVQNLSLLLGVQWLRRGWCTFWRMPCLFLSPLSHWSSPCKSRKLRSNPILTLPLMRGVAWLCIFWHSRMHLQWLLKVEDLRTRHSTLCSHFSGNTVSLFQPEISLSLQPRIAVAHLINHCLSLSIHSAAFYKLHGFGFPPSVSSSEERKSLPISRNSKLCSQMYAATFVHTAIHIICISKAVHTVLYCWLVLFISFSVLPKICFNCKIYQRLFFF